MRTSTVQPPLGLTLNRSHNLCNGLVGFWPLTEGGGLLAFDSTSRANIPGALTAAPTFKQTANGNAVLFNGTTQYISIGSQSATNLTGTMSIVANINSSIVTVGVRGICADYNSGGSASQFSFEINRTAAKLSIVWGNSVIATGTASLLANTWYQVGMSKSGTAGAWQVNLYINGVLDKNAASVVNPSAQQGLSIGRLGNFNGAYFQGLINNLKLYNRCLSATEFMQLYTNPYQMFQQNKPLKN